MILVGKVWWLLQLLFCVVATFSQKRASWPVCYADNNGALMLLEHASKDCANDEKVDLGHCGEWHMYQQQILQGSARTPMDTVLQEEEVLLAARNIHEEDNNWVRSVGDRTLENLDVSRRVW